MLLTPVGIAEEILGRVKQPMTPGVREEMYKDYVDRPFDAALHNVCQSIPMPQVKELEGLFERGDTDGIQRFFTKNVHAGQKWQEGLARFRAQYIK